MFMKFFRTSLVLITLLCLLFGAGIAVADTITFGPSSGDWNNALHWDLLRIPSAGDDVVIDSGKTCKIEDMSTLAFAKTLNLAGTLEIRGEKLILGQSNTDTTSTVDGTVYFEKVGDDAATLMARGGKVTITGTGTLNASKAVNSNYEGTLSLCHQGFFNYSGDGFIIDDDVILKGSLLILACLELNGKAKVNAASDVFQVGAGETMACYGSNCADFVISGTGKFVVSDGMLRFGVVDYESAATPDWQITGGEIEVFADGEYEDVHIMITMTGGVLDFDTPFLNDGGFEFTGGRIERLASQLVRLKR
ncbi:MAG: hypothetical protein IT449_17420 [Phycisphaerales bacterium]|nr:hypothetical protein [Phycisphaerales bacterium]